MRKITLVGLAALLGACADDGGGSQAASFGDAVSAIEMPTGTVDATTAPAVAKEIEEMQQSGADGLAGGFGGAGGFSASTQKQSGDISAGVCSSGSASANVSGEQSNPTVSVSYNNCCIAQGQGCCVDGSFTMFPSDGSSSYSQCYAYDLTSSCEGQSVSVSFDGCLGAEGLVYVVRVDGESFAVTGSYSDGNGTLQIDGANGSFTCTWTNHEGSCTGDGGESFEVSAGDSHGEESEAGASADVEL